MAFVVVVVVDHQHVLLFLLVSCVGYVLSCVVWLTNTDLACVDYVLCCVVLCCVVDQSRFVLC